MRGNSNISKKLHSKYSVKTSFKSTRDVDINKRIITGLFNSFFYIDKDKDMLLPGCAKKSIKDRGANSKAVAKIKHLKDHDFTQNVAKILVLDERTVDFGGKEVQGIYHESYYPDTTLGNDMLINIQEGIYDNRSIGFRYKKIEIAIEDPETFYSDDVDGAIKRQAKRNWDRYFPMALNPEEAEGGYFYIIKEIELYEGSDVSFGANSLTPMLGVKSKDKGTIIKTLQERQDKLMHTVKTGYQSDLCLKELEIQMLQIQQLQKELSESTPLIKDTQKKSLEVKTSPIDFIKIIENLNV